MLIKINAPRFRSKIAFFDFDWTLVRPKDDKTFPVDKDDWQWLRPSVVETIQKYYKKGFAIHIVTNQTKPWKKDQIVHVAQLLGVPLFISIAWEKEQRKPSVFLFEEAYNDIAKREKIKKGRSFMCGDALGRPNDHSSDDLMFGKNIGLKKIYAPEDFFEIESRSEYLS